MSGFDVARKINSNSQYGPHSRIGAQAKQSGSKRPNGRYVVSGDPANLTPESVGKALDLFIAKFPGYDPAHGLQGVYPRDSLIAAWRKMSDLASGALRSLTKAYANVANIVLYQEQLDSVMIPLVQEIQKYDALALVFRAKVTPVIAPSFKDQTVSLLLKVKATLEMVRTIEELKPWWVLAASAFIDAITFVLNLAWDIAVAAVDTVKYVATHTSTLLIGGAVAAFGGLLLFLRKGR